VPSAAALRKEHSEPILQNRGAARQKERGELTAIKGLQKTMGESITHLEHAAAGESTPKKSLTAAPTKAELKAAQKNMNMASKGNFIKEGFGGGFFKKAAAP